MKILILVIHLFNFNGLYPRIQKSIFEEIDCLWNAKRIRIQSFVTALTLVEDMAFVAIVWLTIAETENYQPAISPTILNGDTIGLSIILLGL